ncbi:chitobiase/beta-hexosaminidase C-terminal domain-containing protein [Eubacteriales bacterium mix99]
MKKMNRYLSIALMIVLMWSLVVCSNPGIVMAAAASKENATTSGEDGIPPKEDVMDSEKDNVTSTEDALILEDDTTNPKENIDAPKCGAETSKEDEVNPKGFHSADGKEADSSETSHKIPIKDTDKNNVNDKEDAADQDAAVETDTSVDSPEEVSAILGETQISDGLVMEAAGDHGTHEPLVNDIDGTKCWTMTHEDDVDMFYLRGTVDPDFLGGKAAPLQVQVTYWDSPQNGFFSLMYDAVDNDIKESDKVILSGSNTWKTHTFFLPEAKLQSFNGEYYSFRLGVWVPGSDFSKTPVSISRVALQKPDLLQNVTADVPEGVVESGTEVKLECDENGASIYYTTDGSDPATSDTRAEYSDNAPIVLSRATTIKAYAVKDNQRSLVQTFQYYLPSVSFQFDGQNGTGDGMDAWCVGDVVGDHFRRTTLEGRSCWVSKVEDHSGLYIMCDIGDGFTPKESANYDITVEYLDQGEGRFVVQYEHSNSFVTAPVQLENTDEWKSHTFHLDNVLLNNGTNGADFRIGVWGENMGFSSADVAFASVTVKQTPPAPISVELAGSKSGNIFCNEEPCELGLQLSNRTQENQNLQLSYTVRNSHGSSLLSQDFSVTIPSQQTVHSPIDLSDIHDYGTYTLQLIVHGADDKTILSGEYPFSRVLAQRNNLSDMVGACTHFNQSKGDPDKNFPIAAQAGIKWIRDEMSWSAAETTKGQVKVLPEWDEYIDTAIASCLEPLLILDYGNDLYGGGGPITDEAIAGYSNYCAVIAKHFEGRIKYFEIWNEWNGGMGTDGKLTAKQYSKMMVAASKAIKEVVPDAYIVGGCTAGADISWLQQMIDYPGAYEAVDAVSLHPYVYPSSPESGNVMGSIEQANQIFGDHPAKPIWITEIGWPTHTGISGVSEATSGAYAVRLYTWALANPDKVEHIFWYDLQNDGIDETYNENNFGLIRSFLPKDPVPWSAKENYAALSAFTSKVSDTDFVRKCDLGDGVYAYLFKKKNNGQDILILWSNGTAKNVGITLGDRPLQLSDMFGNSRNAATVDGTLTITLTDQPIYLEGTFADSLAPADSAFSIDPLKEDVVAGNEFTVFIHRSDSAQKLSGEYQVTLPEEWTAKDTTFPSGRDTDVLRIEVPEGTKSGTYSINIHPVSENVVYGSLTLPIRVISQMEYRLIPSVTNGDWRKWKVALNIQNNTASKEMKGSARLLEPAKWNSNNDVIDFDIPAGKENSILFDVPDNPGPKLYTVKVEITQEGQKPTVLEKKISFLAAAKAECPIKVDGTLSPEEWEDAMPFTANDKASYVPLNGGQWGGPEDISATGYLKWDKDNLYLAMNVMDDSHVQTDKGSGIWSGDSVQFCLDPGRSIAPGYYHTNDEIGFALNSQDNAVYHWKWASSAGDDLTMPDAGFSVVRKGTITSYEASIPWSDLVPDPNGIGENVDLGFSLLVNDSDPNEQGIGERKGFVQYMSGVGITKDMAQYGDLVLAEGTNNPPETPEMEEIIQGYMEDGQLNSNLGDQLLYRVSIIQTMVDQKQFAEAVNYLKDLRSYISAPAVLQQGLITKDALDAINAKAQEWIDVLQAK